MILLCFCAIPILLVQNSSTQVYTSSAIAQSEDFLSSQDAAEATSQLLLSLDSYVRNLIYNSVRLCALIISSVAVGVYALWVFLDRSWQNTWDYTLIATGLLCLCFTVYLSTGLPFAPDFGNFSFSMTSLFQGATLAAFFLLISLHLTQGRIMMSAISLCMLLSILLDILYPLFHHTAPVLINQLPQYTALLGFLLALSFSILNWRTSSGFLVCFTPLSVFWLLLYLLYTLIAPGISLTALLIQGELHSFLEPLIHILVASSIVAKGIVLIQSELVRNRSRRLMEQQLALTSASYDHLKKENTKTLVLRHDMLKHFYLLRQTTTDPDTVAYLDELIGETEQVRPTIVSGNPSIDIILNAKLTVLGDQGIPLHLVRTSAPQRFPLSEREICSVFMNIMDNALEALSRYSGDTPYLKLDFSVNHNFFVFLCENATPSAPPEPRQGHGLGLTIIQNIVEKHGGTLVITHAEEVFSLRLAIPLDAD